MQKHYEQGVGKREAEENQG